MASKESDITLQAGAFLKTFRTANDRLRALIERHDAEKEKLNEHIDQLTKELSDARSLLNENAEVNARLQGQLANLAQYNKDNNCLAESQENINQQEIYNNEIVALLHKIVRNLGRVIEENKEADSEIDKLSQQSPEQQLETKLLALHLENEDGASEKKKSPMEMKLEEFSGLKPKEIVGTSSSIGGEIQFLMQLENCDANEIVLVPIPLSQALLRYPDFVVDFLSQEEV